MVVDAGRAAGIIGAAYCAARMSAPVSNDIYIMTLSCSRDESQNMNDDIFAHVRRANIDVMHSMQAAHVHGFVMHSMKGIERMQAAWLGTAPRARACLKPPVYFLRPLRARFCSITSRMQIASRNLI